MTEEEKKLIRENAYSLPPTVEPEGKLLFSEKKGDDTYYYYDCDEKGEYRWDCESYRRYRIRRRKEKKQRAAERRGSVLT